MKKKRPAGIIAAIIAACLLVGVGVFFGIQWFATSSVEQREAGAWPNYDYLATLVDKPDQFIRAVNISELSDSYNQRNSNEATTLSAYIDIADIENHDKEDQKDNGVQFTVSITPDGNIDSFELKYQPPSFIQPIDSPRILTSYFHLNSVFKGYTQESPEDTYNKLLSHGEELSDPYWTTDRLIKGYLLDPTLLLTNVGISDSNLSNVSRFFAQASWPNGYACSINELYRQLDYDNPPELTMPETGIINVSEGEIKENNRGSIYSYIVDTTEFHWNFSEYNGVTVNLGKGILETENNAWFMIAFSVVGDKPMSPQEALGVEENDYNKAIWKFTTE